VLVLVLGALVALYAPTLGWLFDRWTMSVWHHAHGLFIPPVVGYFVSQELRRLRHLPRSASAWGFAVLVPALALHALDAGMHTQLLSAVTLVVALPGLSLLFLGWPRTQAILFPLAFAAFMVPIPLSLMAPAHMQLREIATSSVTWLTPLFGVPVFAEGTTVHLPNASLLIADACSGFSTVYASVAVALVTAYVSADPRRRLLVLVAAAPVAIAANIVRVTLIVLLVWWQGREVLATPLHSLTGMLTFALALPLIFWLGRDSKVKR